MVYHLTKLMNIRSERERKRERQLIETFGKLFLCGKFTYVNQSKISLNPQLSVEEGEREKQWYIHICIYIYRYT